MTQCRLFLTCLLTMSELAIAADGNRQKNAPTNVVFILIEDLGCYGSTYYQTPHIDEILSEVVACD